MENPVLCIVLLKLKFMRNDNVTFCTLKWVIYQYTWRKAWQKGVAKRHYSWIDELGEQITLLSFFSVVFCLFSIWSNTALEIWYRFDILLINYKLQDNILKFKLRLTKKGILILYLLNLFSTKWPETVMVNE